MEGLVGEGEEREGMEERVVLGAEWVAMAVEAAAREGQAGEAEGEEVTPIHCPLS